MTASANTIGSNKMTETDTISADDTVETESPEPSDAAELAAARAAWETERQQMREQIASLRIGLGDLGRTHAMARQMWVSSVGKAEATHAQAWSQLDSAREEHRTELAALQARLDALQAQSQAATQAWDDERLTLAQQLEAAQGQVAQLQDQAGAEAHARELERQAHLAESAELRAQVDAVRDEQQAQQRQSAAEKAQAEAEHLRLLDDERARARSLRAELERRHAQQNDALQAELSQALTQAQVDRAASEELRERLAEASSARQAERLQAQEERAAWQARQTELEHRHDLQRREWEDTAAHLREALQAQHERREGERQRHADELAALRAGLESSQGTALLAMERLREQAESREADWERRLQQQDDQWQQRLQDLRTHLAVRHDDAAQAWTGRLAAAEAAAEGARQAHEQALRQLAAERREWQVRSEAAVEASRQESAALQLRHAEAALALRQEVDTELAWWRKELTEARRQLQHAQLALSRQADQSGRLLQSLRAQQQQERAQMQAAVQRAQLGMAGLAQKVGGQLESLRIAPPLRVRSRHAETLETLRALQQQVHETANALGDTRPLLGLAAPEPEVPTLSQLMGLDDHDFIRQAYRVVLRREPDSDGQEHYAQRLRQGEHRLRVLADLRLSAEGRSVEPLLPGLDDLLRSLRKSRVPLLGRRERRRLQDALVASDGPDPHLPALDAASPHLARIEASLDDLGRGSAWLAETVPIAVSLGRAPREFGLDPWACAQELARAEGDAFIDLAYALLFRRPPTDAERQTETRRLVAGASRVHLLDLMLDQATGTAPAADGASSTLSAKSLLALGSFPQLPSHERPEVTVIVPVTGSLDTSLRCLRAIARHPAHVPFEVLAVVDGRSPADAAQALANIRGLRVVHHTGEPGWAAACNAAAATARGAWLHVLHDGMEAQPGWLDELRRTFDRFPGTGLAGSKRLRPDGLLAAAGHLLWQDGSIAPVGPGDDPALPRHDHAREVDGFDGASLMVPRHLFEAVGGFDTALPAGSEAMGLALALQDRGYRAVYQPGSVVAQQDGSTALPASPPDGAQGLRHRWGTRLAQHATAGSPVDGAAGRQPTGRLLAIEHRLPRPDRDAGSVSVFNLLVAARELGLRVSLMAEADVADGVAADPRYVELLQRSGIEVLQAPHVTSLADHLAREGGRFDAVLLFRPLVMERHATVIERLCPRAKRLYYPHDLHFLRKARQAAWSGDTELAERAARSRPLELALHRRAHLTLVASEAERALLEAEGQGDRTRWLPLLLDTTRFERPAAERRGLLFVGNFHHAPNVDALAQLVQDIMPRARAARPDLELWVVGEDPPAEMTQRDDPGVHYLGACDDLGPLLASARVAVAPLRFGAGAKGKVARALAAGLPVVASSPAIEGMGLVPGQHLLLADDADSFTDAVCRLHDDASSLWQQLSDAGHRHAVAHWGPKAATRALADVLRELDIPLRQPAFGSGFFHEDITNPRPAAPLSTTTR